MPDTYTPYYNLTLVEHGTINWSGKVNQNFHELDGLIKGMFELLSSLSGGTPISGVVTSVNGKTGAVNLNLSDLGGLTDAELNSLIQAHIEQALIAAGIDEFVAIGLASQDYVRQQIAAQDDFSMSEKVYGKWIDNKPVYRRTINLGFMPNSSTITVPHGITALKQAVDYDPSYFNSVTRTTIFAGEGISITINDTDLIATTQSDMSAYTGLVTVYYTKTTD